MVCGLGFDVMPAMAGEGRGGGWGGQALFIPTAFQERKEQVLSESQHAADELCFTLCSSLPLPPSDLKML